jgi:hypothetical protein
METKGFPNASTFFTCLLEESREYFTPLRRFAEERFAMTLFATQHERRGYLAQGNTWSPADRAAMCAKTSQLVDVRIRS